MELFADLTLHALVCIHLVTFIVLHGYFSLVKTSGPATKSAGSEFLLMCYYVRSGVGVSARRIGSTMKFSIAFFLKALTKLFYCSKDKFREHLIYGGG